MKTKGKGFFTAMAALLARLSGGLATSPRQVVDVDNRRKGGYTLGNIPPAWKGKRQARTNRGGK